VSDRDAKIAERDAEAARIRDEDWAAKAQSERDAVTRERDEEIASRMGGAGSAHGVEKPLPTAAEQTAAAQKDAKERAAAAVAAAAERAAAAEQAAAERAASVPPASASDAPSAAAVSVPVGVLPDVPPPRDAPAGSQAAVASVPTSPTLPDVPPPRDAPAVPGVPTLPPTGRQTGAAADSLG